MSDRQKAYLRKHDVPVVLDNIVRQMLEEKPAKPFGYIVQQLKEVQKTREGGKPAEDKDKEKPKEEEVIDLSKMTPEDQDKIVKIQAQYRGGKARSEVDALKKDKEAAPEKSEKAEKAEINTEGWNDEDKEKLVKIQARYRGGKGRQEAEDKKAAKEADAPKENGDEAKKEEEKPAEGDKPAEEATPEKKDEEKPAEDKKEEEKKEEEKPAEEKKEEEKPAEAEASDEKKEEEAKPAEAGEKPAEAAAAEEKKEPAEDKKEEEKAEKPAEAEDAKKE